MGSILDSAPLCLLSALPELIARVAPDRNFLPTADARCTRDPRQPECRLYGHFREGLFPDVGGAAQAPSLPT